MKTFLQSAIDCFGDKNSRASYSDITDNEQYKIVDDFYGFINYGQFSYDETNERSIYFLLFIAAERGEL